MVFQKGNQVGKKTWFKKGHKISKALRKKISETNKKYFGEKAINWQGGRWKSRGYVQVWKPNHPHANNNGYIREHRLFYEKKLGRYLTKEEVVHHENDIRDDNRIENLKLFKNQNEHLRYHNLNPKKSTYKRIINFILNMFRRKK